ncbi:MAG: hypothetical protein VB042_08785 [Victivallaceae bacterium]|nr:hypothetical protein [Victivallaceae bacterium]
MSDDFTIPAGTDPDTVLLPAHTHAIGEVTGLPEALDSRSLQGHGHVVSDVSGLAEELAQLEQKTQEAAAAAAAALANTQPPAIPDYTAVGGLVEQLAGKSNTGHGHTVSDIDGLADELLTLSGSVSGGGGLVALPDCALLAQPAEGYYTVRLSYPGSGHRFSMRVTALAAGDAEVTASGFADGDVFMLDFTTSAAAAYNARVNGKVFPVRYAEGDAANGLTLMLLQHSGALVPVNAWNGAGNQVVASGAWAPRKITWVTGQMANLVYSSGTVTGATYSRTAAQLGLAGETQIQVLVDGAIVAAGDDKHHFYWSDGTLYLQFQNYTTTLYGRSFALLYTGCSGGTILNQ